MQLNVATVTTASKRAEKSTEAPGMVIVIDKRDIRLRGYSTIKDVLRDLPGMETIEFYHTELGTQVPVRGIVGNNKIIFLINGMRVNPPAGDEMPIRSDFSVRQAEQIEVIYGPGSTLYGQDAISAVINIKTRRPEAAPAAATVSDGKGATPAPTPASGPMEIELGGDYGLHEEREAWGYFGKVFDSARNILFTGYFQYHDSELTRLDKEFPAYWRDFKAVAEPKGAGTVPWREDFGLNAFARLDVGDFSLQAWHRESQRSPSEGILPAFGFTSDAKWRDRSTVVEAKYTIHVSETASLDTTVTYNRYEIDPSTEFATPASPTEWLRDYKYGMGAGLSVEETLKWDLFDHRVSLLVGGVAAHFESIPKASIPGRNAHPSGFLWPDDGIIEQAGNIVYSSTNDGIFEGAVPRAGKVEYERYSGYLEAGWKVTDSLKIIAGVRVDKDTRIDEASWTPRAAVVYNITPQFTAKYAYREAYIAPSPYFTTGTFQNSVVLLTTNDALQPEKEKTHELNFTYDKQNVNLGLSLFYGMQEGLIKSPIRGVQGQTILDPIFVPPGLNNQRRLVQAANGGESTNIGLDFYGRLTLGNFSPWFSYSYVDFQEKTNGVTLGLQAISRHNGRFGFTWAVTPQFFVTPSLVIRSTPEDIDDSVLPGDADIPWEANLHVLYALNKNCEIFATLRNLTDNHYALGGSRAATPAGNTRVIPQEVFSGVIGMRLTF
jgi:outer membrane receptor protein involved in Fe transport